MTERATDVFLSYRSPDLAHAERLRDCLEEAGFSVWLDRSRLRPGYDWYAEIDAAVEASGVVVPVLTPRWAESQWTRFETYGAAAVVPVLCEGEIEEVAPPPLVRFQAVDLREGTPEAWTSFVEAVREQLARPRQDKAERMAHLRYRANPHFTGREKELLAISRGSRRRAGPGEARS